MENLIVEDDFNFKTATRFEKDDKKELERFIEIWIVKDNYAMNLYNIFEKDDKIYYSFNPSHNFTFYVGYRYKKDWSLQNRKILNIHFLENIYMPKSGTKGKGKVGDFFKKIYKTG